MSMRQKRKALTKLSDYSIGERVSYLRRKRNLKQIELAKLTKLSQSTIAQIENGQKDPSLKTLEIIAKALDVHIAVLFASESVHVFDMSRLKKKYQKVDDLNDTLYRGIGEILRFAKQIGY